MRLTTGERTCFNSMLDPTPILGFHGSEHAKEEKEVTSTIESLKIHEFLDEKGQPNKKFVLGVELLKRYKQARKHLIINDYRIAVIEKQPYIIILNRIGHEWELELQSKIGFFKSLVTANDFLTRPKMEDMKKARFLVQKQWMNSILKQEMGRFLWIQVIVRGRAKEPIIIYEQNGTSYMYDSKKERLIEDDIASMQIMLANVLEIPVEKGEIKRGWNN